MLGLRRSILLGSLLSCALACDEPEQLDASGDESGDELAPGIRPASVRWTLDWRAVDSGEIVNDLGYRVRVDAGWIGTWGMTLVECASADLDAAIVEPDSVAGEPGIASPWLVAEGHSTGEDDPSAWVYAGVESLIDRAPVGSEPRSLGAARYCQAHYLLAPLSEASEGFAAAEAALAQIDPQLSLAGASVVIVGSWEPPGGGEATPFSLRSEQGYGKIVELELGERAGELDDAAIELVMRRELASMFDGIEFADADPDDASWQLLGNLAKHIHAEVWPS